MTFFPDSTVGRTTCSKNSRSLAENCVLPVSVHD